MAKAEITPGVCALCTRIEATYDDETGGVALSLSTECALTQRRAELRPAVNAHAAAFAPAPSNPVILAGAEARLHPSCVVPVAIIRTVEVAAGLALPRDVVVKIEK